MSTSFHIFTVCQVFVHSLYSVSKLVKIWSGFSVYLETNVNSLRIWARLLWGLVRWSSLRFSCRWKASSSCNRSNIFLLIRQDPIQRSRRLAAPQLKWWLLRWAEKCITIFFCTWTRCKKREWVSSKPIYVQWKLHRLFKFFIYNYIIVIQKLILFSSLKIICLILFISSEIIWFILLSSSKIINSFYHVLHFFFF